MGVVAKPKQVDVGGFKVVGSECDGRTVERLFLPFSLSSTHLFFILQSTPGPILMLPGYQPEFQRHQKGSPLWGLSSPITQGTIRT